MSPPIIHAAKTSLADPTARAMSLVTRKMPVPIVSLITIAVADHRPKARTRSDRSEGLVGLGLVALTKADRAYYQGLGWSTNDASWQDGGKSELNVLMALSLFYGLSSNLKWPRKKPC